MGLLSILLAGWLGSTCLCPRTSHISSSLYPHNSPKRHVLLLSPFNRWGLGPWGVWSLGEATQLVPKSPGSPCTRISPGTLGCLSPPGGREKPGIQTQAPCLPHLSAFVVRERSWWARHLTPISRFIIGYTGLGRDSDPQPPRRQSRSGAEVEPAPSTQPPSSSDPGSARGDVMGVGSGLWPGFWPQLWSPRTPVAPLNPPWPAHRKDTAAVSWARRIIARSLRASL